MKLWAADIWYWVVAGLMNFYKSPAENRKELHMDFIRIVLGAFIGTSIMTMFSYYISSKLNRQFKEPVLLNMLYAGRGARGGSLKAVPGFGWIFHYFIGTIFVIVYHFIWKMTAVDPTFLSGSLLGLLSGFIGIAGWSFMFNVHPDPPIIHFRKFYLQLIAAHLIFGLGAVFGYKLI